ncbi:MAG: sugar phosphate isomerase/epimerase [Cytophagaceae bacterium]|jgi:sugar phosphate isomerase/epimerase|nr:sugar phosphate isomerase/epimerase [Cytophagaceae bacterium]
MANRRDFIKMTSLAVAGGLVGSKLLTSCTPSVKKHIGLQLYSLRDDVKDIGIRPVLETVAKMGYVNLETAGYSDGKIYGLTPAEFKKIVDDLGMKVTSSHVGRNISESEDADMSWWNEAVEAHNTAGMKYMVMPWSPLGGASATMDNVKRYSDYFNKVGLIVAGASMKFGYHNHAFEFEDKIDGVPLYDLLVENTSEHHVMFQLDVYWCKVGGFDPLVYLDKYSKRIQTLHIKDEKAIGASGKFDYKPMFDKFYANGMKDWYVEVEQYISTPQEDVKQSFDYLNNAEYVK